jgi:hypothetical protein
MNMGGDSRLILTSYTELGTQILSRTLISPTESQSFSASKI